MLLLAAIFAGPALAQTANVLIKVPTGTETPESLSITLAAWRQSGQVSDAIWLEADDEKGAAFSKFIALEFPTEGSYQAWVREGQPKLASSLDVKRVDECEKDTLADRLHQVVVRTGVQHLDDLFLEIPLRDEDNWHRLAAM